MIECEPTESEAVVKVAWPALRLAVPRVVAPSLNVTVPVGVPLPGGVEVTVAVKVTAWPNTDGLPEAVTAVLVSALTMGVLKVT